MDNFANLISIISGIMTIFGVTGVVSWSLYKETGESFSQATMSIFAKSFKLALCIVSFLLFLILLYLIHVSIVISLGEGWMPGSTRNPDFWWKNSDWYAYVVSYCLIVLIGIPFYSLIASSIYTWSLSPFRIFWTHLRKR